MAADSGTTTLPSVRWTLVVIVTLRDKTLDDASGLREALRSTISRVVGQFGLSCDEVNEASLSGQERSPRINCLVHVDDTRHTFDIDPFDEERMTGTLTSLAKLIYRKVREEQRTCPTFESFLHTSKPAPASQPIAIPVDRSFTE